MFKVKWDLEINGVILANTTNDQETLSSPRPVYFEELNLLGFNKYWIYPQSEEPLLWAIGRKYFYKGVFVAEAKGGNLYEVPEIIITEEGKDLKLKPINIKKIIKRNRKLLFILENEAIDFVEDIYKKYKKKVDFITVSFSGGKDSQVVLDIVSRVLHPEDYIVIFSNTTMEIPYTYEAVERTKKEYKKKYPKLKFYTVKPVKEALEFWGYFGPPSRFHRWCCTVTKTAPFVKKVGELYREKDIGKTPRILVFEGVRKEESTTRSNYARISLDAKHFKQINAEPIQNWSLTEVYLYAYFRSIVLNKGYRIGLTRVGCSICPFASAWSEYVLDKYFPKMTNLYIDVIKRNTNLSLTEGADEFKKYLVEGQWKKRAGGRDLEKVNNFLHIIESENRLEAIINEPNESITEFLKIIGNVYYKKDNAIIIGEISSDNLDINFSIEENKYNNIKFSSTFNNKDIASKLKKVLNKATYCVNCGACEAECPTGALRTYPKVSINSNTCIHCFNCLDFAENGCLVAKSVHVTKGNYRMKLDKENFNKEKKGSDRVEKIATSKYQTFGLREEWLDTFLKEPSAFFQNTNLGNRQIQSLIIWLKEAELLDKGNVPTKLTELLTEAWKLNKQFVWEVVLTNLYFNSTIVRWYLNEFSWGIELDPEDIEIKIRNIDLNAGLRTIKNTVASLLNLFESSSIGNNFKIGYIVKNGRLRKIKKIGITKIINWGIAYNLFKTSENLKIKEFTISELYSHGFVGGPSTIFGIDKEEFKKSLISIQEKFENVLHVDLAAGLDNIHLGENVNSIDIIKLANREIK